MKRGLERSLTFHDMLYGVISLPTALEPFTRLPEFLRLRYVRLSNVDSISYKDFGSATRWEHGIAAAYLASLSSQAVGLPALSELELTIAALLHDVATPPFAHTAEYVLDGFDHAEETYRLFTGKETEASPSSFPVFGKAPSQFRRVCAQVSRRYHLSLDPDRIAEMIPGGGSLGYLISGFVDVDNIDNVTRASTFMGFEVDTAMPLRLARFLGERGRPVIGPDDSGNGDLATWVSYRNRLYAEFFLADRRESARQAWLQTLMRHGLERGLPRSRLVWNTDEGLLADLDVLFADDEQLSAALVDYRLLRPTTCIAEVPVEDADLARRLARPEVAARLEQLLSGRDGLASVLVSRRRVPIEGSLLDLPWAYVRVFVFATVGRDFIRRRLDRLAAEGFEVSESPSAKGLQRAVGRAVVSKKLQHRASSNHHSVIAALESVRDWSFRSERNVNFAPYPATWVHSLPATLLRCLGLRGRRVLDPFGGTGQTAVEGIRYGSRVTSIDSNAVASLIARARTTFLSAEERGSLLALASSPVAGDDVGSWMPGPISAEIEKWFHPGTVEGLASVLHHISQLSTAPERQFAEASFVGTLNFCSSRRGMGNGHFSDNTPRGRSGDPAPYVDVGRVFAERLRRNLLWYEAFAAQVARFTSDVEESFGLSEVIYGDSIYSDSPFPHGLDAIITSPPYLGMVDYALGQRLAYYWLFPDALDIDAAIELGKRRSRNNVNALPSYLTAMAEFARRASASLTHDGYVAMVVGNSTAKAFAQQDVVELILDTFVSHGFLLVWQAERRVSAHRIHNLHRLTAERIVVLRANRAG